MCNNAARRSDGHLSRTVGGVALVPGVVVVGGLRYVLPRPLYVLPRPRPASASSVHPPVGLAEEIRHVLYAVLPPGGVAVPPGGTVHGGRVARGRGLPVDVAAGRLPGLEGRAGEHRVRGGLGEARVLQVAGRDGDGEGAVEVVEVVVRRQRLVDVRLVFGLHGHRLEGRRRHRLVLGEVHEWEALVVATRRTVRCNEERGGWRGEVIGSFRFITNFQSHFCPNKLWKNLNMATLQKRIWCKKLEWVPG